MGSNKKGTWQDSITLHDYELDSNVTLDMSSSLSSTIDEITITSGSIGAPSYTLGAVGSSNLSSIWSVGTSTTDASWQIPLQNNWLNATNGVHSSITQAGTMDLRGENADIRINGKSLSKAIEAIEERLAILRPDPELEAEWDELRELGERYRELEKKCKEKGEMWKKLKSMPPPQVD